MFAVWLAHIDRVLLATGRANRDWLAATVWGGVCYGAVMGTFGGFAGDRGLQILFSAMKVPMLIAVTTLLALPCFFVMNTLVGLRDDLSLAIRAVIATQGAVGVILAALAPLTAVWYLGSAEYHEAILFNGVMFAVASLAGQWVLRRRYRSRTEQPSPRQHMPRQIELRAAQEQGGKDNARHLRAVINFAIRPGGGRTMDHNIDADEFVMRH